jgi:hypothetical protein
VAQGKNKGDDHDTLHDEHPPFDLHRTLPTGAAFKQTWKMPALRPSGSPPPDPVPDTSNVSGVRSLASSDLSRGKTLVSMVPPSDPPPRHSVFQQNEPRDTLEPAAPAEAQSPTRRAAFARSQETVHAVSTHRVGDSDAPEPDSTRPRSIRPTDPFGLPAQRADQTAPDVAFADTEPSRQAFALPQSSAPASTNQGLPPSAAPSARPRVSTPSAKPAAPRSWLPAALSVGALVIAGALLWVTTDPEAELPAFGSDATHGAHVVMPAPLAPAQEPLAPAANVTELSSEPAGAEVVLNGAVVANTPTRITRTTYEVDYLVRLPGHDAQLIRVGPKSPAQITVRLLPMAPERSK